MLAVAASPGDGEGGVLHSLSCAAFYPARVYSVYYIFLFCWIFVLEVFVLTCVQDFVVIYSAVRVLCLYLLQAVLVLYCFNPAF